MSDGRPPEETPGATLGPPGGPGATPDEPGLTLDCRGMRCPLPVIHLARRIGEVPVGGVVRVLADDPAARNDIPAWCRMKAHDYLGAADEHAFDVRRRG